MTKHNSRFEIRRFGHVEHSKQIDKVTISNSNGMKVSYIDYACTITSIEVPDSQGNFSNVILSLPNLESYLVTNRRFAAIMGRYAGRIDQGQYTLDGKKYQLPINALGIALHGDPSGFDRRTWARSDFNTTHALGSKFKLHSPHGDQGHPGNLDIEVTYQLLKQKNEFHISYQAISDMSAVINLTNHAYFNLAGAGTSTLSSHLFQIDADHFLETQDNKIPTGKMLSVHSTALDLRKPVNVMPWIESDDPMVGDPQGYDHTMVLNHHDGQLREVAGVHEIHTGRTLKIKTTEPAIQFNTGNGFNRTEMGSEGIAYDKYDGFALETFHFPDSPNHRHFPSTELKPDQPFKSKTVYVFD